MKKLTINGVIRILVIVLMGVAVLMPMNNVLAYGGGYNYGGYRDGKHQYGDHHRQYGGQKYDAHSQKYRGQYDGYRKGCYKVCDKFLFVKWNCHWKCDNDRHGWR